MNAKRARKVRFAAKHIMANWSDEIARAVSDKIGQPNIHGRPQHRTINPARQVRRMVVRERIA